MLKIFDTEEVLADELAIEMGNQLEISQNPVFCLASGSTPAKTYHKFIEKKQFIKSIEKLRFIGLDEWVGIERRVDGSCYQMLSKDLFQYLPLREEQIYFFNGMSEELDKECKRMDQCVKENPITFSLMGVGMNGHIGLNEPGEPVKNYSSIVPLSNTTKNVATKYFKKEPLLTNGITLGIGQIIKSKRVVAVITGKHKKEIVKEIFENKNANLPIQELLGHSHIDFYLDKDAFSLVSEMTVKEYLE